MKGVRREEGKWRLAQALECVNPCKGRGVKNAMVILVPGDELMNNYASSTSVHGSEDAGQSASLVKRGAEGKLGESSVPFAARFLQLQEERFPVGVCKGGAQRTQVFGHRAKAKKFGIRHFGRWTNSKGTDGRRNICQTI
jgi:hypothetical protein